MYVVLFGQATPGTESHWTAIAGIQRPDSNCRGMPSVIVSVTIRPAHRADIRTLTVIRRDAILALAAPMMGGRGARDWANSSSDERVHRAIEQHEVWVADHVNAAVGWVEINRDRVEGMYVRPDLAKCGIGSALLQHAERLIRSAGHSGVALDASPNAEQFYFRHGYNALSEETADEGRPMFKTLRGTE